jgi:outer membrane lipoprotein-sorting protein
MRPAILLLLTLTASLGLMLSVSTTAGEELSLDQILDAAYQREKAFHEYLKDYICRVTSIVSEPRKDGPVKTLSIVEKTVYRMLPDKRVEKYNTIIRDGRELSAQEVAQRQKNQQAITLGQGRSFFGPQGRVNYTYELMPPDTIRGVPAHVLRIKPNKKQRDLVDGKLWLHQGNFEVLRLHFRPAKNPPFVKNAAVIFEFDEVQPGLWLPSEIKIDAHAGFLFIQKNRQVHETWRDYQINVGLPDSLFAEEQ